MTLGPTFYCQSCGAQRWMQDERPLDPCEHCEGKLWVSWVPSSWAPMVTPESAFQVVEHAERQEQRKGKKPRKPRLARSRAHLRVIDGGQE